LSHLSVNDSSVSQFIPGNFVWIKQHFSKMPFIKQKKGLIDCLDINIIF
jgi:hypothetical protein